MQTIVRKLKNIVDMDISVQTGLNTTIYLKPGQILENQIVYNLDEIRSYCSIEQDLTEVNPIVEKRGHLYD